MNDISDVYTLPHPTHEQLQRFLFDNVQKVVGMYKVFMLRVCMLAADIYINCNSQIFHLSHLLRMGAKVKFAFEVGALIVILAKAKSVFELDALIVILAKAKSAFELGSFIVIR
jgi:hypothetical protein